MERGTDGVKYACKQEGDRTFLVLEEEGTFRYDYRIGMLLANNPEGLLPCSLQRVDEKWLFCYDITGRVGLGTYLKEQGADHELLQSLLFGLAQAEEACREYLLDAGNLVILADCIYLKEKEAAFCCLPIRTEPILPALSALLDLFGSYRNKNEFCEPDPAAAMRRRLEEGASLRDLLGELQPSCACRTERASEGEEEEPVPEEEEEPKKRKRRCSPFAQKKKKLCIRMLIVLGFLLCVLLFQRETGNAGRAAAGGLLLFVMGNYLYEKVGGIKRFVRKQKHAVQKEKEKRQEPEPVEIEDPDSFFFDEEVMDEDPATVFLEPEKPTSVPILCSEQSDEQIRVDHADFLIGSKEESVQGVILNPAVSRIHARLEQLAGSWYLEDLKSTNGTYLNRNRLEPGDRIELSDGDRILFANAEYRVLLR